MKLSEEQLLFIDKHIDSTLIDKEKLIEYLEKHRIIKNDIFAKCAKRGKKQKWSDEDYCGLLNHPQAFSPVTRDVFIRRIPILFHCSSYGLENKHQSGLRNILPVVNKKTNPDALEALYLDLEFMYYDLHIDLQNICNYATDQVFRHRKLKKTNAKGLLLAFPDDTEDDMFGISGEITDEELFDMWRHYLKLCVQLECKNYLPERFLSAYNYVLEAAGYEPIIYRPLAQYGSFYFSRYGNEFICKGNFPCDNQGIPILRWTNIKVKNEKSITFSGNRSQAGILKIELQPNTTIHLLGEDNFYDRETEPDDNWYQIYIGPLNTEFDYSMLKEYRIIRGYTQKEVADAIGANVRTYQKWESGNSTPDGHYLLRIINWLQIENIQDLIINNYPLDEDNDD